MSHFSFLVFIRLSAFRLLAAAHVLEVTAQDLVGRIHSHRAAIHIQRRIVGAKAVDDRIGNELCPILHRDEAVARGVTRHCRPDLDEFCDEARVRAAQIELALAEFANDHAPGIRIVELAACHVVDALRIVPARDAEPCRDIQHAAALFEAAVGMDADLEVLSEDGLAVREGEHALRPPGLVLPGRERDCCDGGHQRPRCTLKSEGAQMHAFTQHTNYNQCGHQPKVASIYGHCVCNVTFVLEANSNVRNTSNILRQLVVQRLRAYVARNARSAFRPVLAEVFPYSRRAGCRRLAGPSTQNVAHSRGR